MRLRPLFFLIATGALAAHLGYAQEPEALLTEQPQQNSLPPSSTVTVEKKSVLRLQEYQASYDVIEGKKSRGTVQRQLKFENGIWQLNVSTRIKQWFFKYSFVETSTFQYDNGKITPLIYTANTERSFKSPRRIRQEFNWRSGIENGSENKRHWEEPITDNLLDHLNYQVALRESAANKRSLDEPMIISYRGGHRNYQFEQQQEEEIHTPLGKIKATLYTQIVANPKKEKYLKLWLAPDYHFIPIQFERFSKGKKEATVRLKSIQWSDESI